MSARKRTGDKKTHEKTKKARIAPAKVPTSCECCGRVSKDLHLLSCSFYNCWQTTHVCAQCDPVTGLNEQFADCIRCEKIACLTHGFRHTTADVFICTPCCVPTVVEEHEQMRGALVNIKAQLSAISKGGDAATALQDIAKILPLCQYPAKM